jgi:hypothetical protein
MCTKQNDPSKIFKLEIVARRRLNEQTKATNVMTISQAYNVCQSSGDENGAREMHHLMLTMARAAARSHIGDLVDVDLE